ncbi:tetratricopeptide repeat protein [Candidatus Pelagibacter sp.]|nr:tetratricopeptide repeat protein [Candidatus Pelagibacter sp.]
MTIIKKKNIEALFNQAEELRNSGNFSDAIKILKNILKNEPNLTAVLNSIANCYFQTNKIDLAEKYYLLCLKNDPSNLQILNNLGLLYLRNKDLKNALSILQKSLEKNNEQENVIEKISYCLVEMKLYLEVNKFCEKFLKKYPKNKFLLDYYEKSFFKLGKNIDGLKLLQKQTGFIQFDDDKINLV